MKFVFPYKYCLVHYFQFRIIDGSSSNKKIAEKVNDSDFTEIDLIVPPYAMRFYRQTDITDIQ